MQKIWLWTKNGIDYSDRYCRYENNLIADVETGEIIKVLPSQVEEVPGIGDRCLLSFTPLYDYYWNRFLEEEEKCPSKTTIVNHEVVVLPQRTLSRAAIDAKRKAESLHFQSWTGETFIIQSIRESIAIAKSLSGDRVSLPLYCFRKLKSQDTHNGI